MEFVAPAAHLKAFNCPHCGVYTTQRWRRLYADASSSVAPYQEVKSLTGHSIVTGYRPVFGTGGLKGPAAFLPSVRNEVDGCRAEHLWHVHVSECFHCSKLVIWIARRIIYPLSGNAPPANTDLPADVERDYREAASIVALSPRGSAALLRLCIQKLCMHLGKAGKNLNKDIGALVEEGLGVEAQMAFDVVRVTGNEAVHPGSLDLRDDQTTAATLFALVNLIAEETITKPARLRKVYDSLPQEKRDEIERRDARAIMVRVKQDGSATSSGTTEE